MKKIIFLFIIIIIFLIGCTQKNSNELPKNIVIFKIDLSNISYNENRIIKEDKFSNLIKKGSKICTKELSQIIYPSIYKEYEEIEISTQGIKNGDWVIYNINAKDRHDIEGSPLSKGINYNDAYTIDAKYDECKFRLHEFGK